MNTGRSRRDVLKIAWVAGLRAQAAEKPARIGIVGVGRRGTSLLRTLLSLGVEVPAICDIDPASLSRAQEMVRKTGQPRPEGYGRGPEDFRRLVARDDLKAVVNATSWEWHTPIAVATMQAGKYAGVEVPAALSIEECWQLVRTSRQTGMPCMMLENVCYFRNVLMVLNLVREGILGEVLHCKAGYQHYIRGSQFGKDGALSWRAKYALTRNGNQYPTHPIGPVAWWMNINRGDRFSYLTSMSTPALGSRMYAVETFGADHPAARKSFAQGDVNTTMIKTERGFTVTLYYNTQSPRPYDLILDVQGTRGIYSGTLDKLFVQGRTPMKSAEPSWEDAAPYYQQYEHPLWKAQGESAVKHGHGGADYLTLYQFVKAVRDRTPTPIDACDTATWSAIVPLTQQSVASRSAPVEFPDFTEGKWQTAKPVDPGQV
ncbi:MAG TPA: Gfo/Idh/MocA family oxidoreductase [Bryobacteraceae bacterium]|nr:Gfo/Idh/MocA family oxidoreductase [Bryobacteraceae bacterium]